MTNDKKAERQKPLKDLIENLRTQEDKLIAAHGVTNQDSQKAAHAIKSLTSD